MTAIVAALSVPVRVAADGPASKKEVLRRAAAYVEAQADLLPQLVAEERTRQRQEPRLRADDRTVARVERQTWADFAWIHVDGMPDALGVRDVRGVDGLTVGDEGRLERLLRTPMEERYGAVQKLLAESARYNLVPGSRNMNLPTFALFLLHQKLQPRFSWKDAGTEGRLVVLDYEEKERPTIIRGPRLENAFCRGRIWINPATGEVLRTELHARIKPVDDDFYTTYSMTVEFGIDSALQLLLPRRLRERYETRMTVVTGDAVYTNYRRFQTEGRLVR